MAKYNFSANGVDYGDYEGATLDDARDVFAKASGYLSWADMVERAEEFGGNTVEIREYEPSGHLSQSTS